MVDFQARDTRRDDEERDAGATSDEAGEDAAVEESDDHAADHDHHHHDVENLGIAVVTISSSRTLEEDDSGDAIVEVVEAAGHEVVTRDVVNDDLDTVQRTVDVLVGRADVDLLITTGGTGVTPDDVTIEAVRPLLDKELPGFGELFRRYSEDEIGTRVIGTRAKGGIADGVPVFCLPGSENAVLLGTEDVILPEAGHLVGLAGRRATDGAESTE